MNIPYVPDSMHAGKKLKRRLEDLERRAGSQSPPPEKQSSQGTPRNQRNEDNTRKKRASRNGVSPPGAPSRPAPMTTSSFSPQEDPPNMFARQHTRQLSASPPPAFTYSFPASEPPPTQPQYPQHAPFHSLPYPEYPNHAFYLPPLPTARPGLGSFDPTPAKPDPNFPDEDLTGQFSMDYSNASTAGEVSASHVGTSSNPLLNVKWPPRPNFQPLSPPVALH